VCHIYEKNLIIKTKNKFVDNLIHKKIFFVIPLGVHTSVFVKKVAIAVEWWNKKKVGEHQVKKMNPP
jgi:hypothetical protein